MTILYITKRFTDPWQLDHPRDKLLFTARNSFIINRCTVYTYRDNSWCSSPVTTLSPSEVLYHSLWQPGTSYGRAPVTNLGSVALPITWNPGTSAMMRPWQHEAHLLELSWFISHETLETVAAPAPVTNLRTVNVPRCAQLFKALLWQPSVYLMQM